MALRMTLQPLLFEHIPNFFVMVVATRSWNYSLLAHAADCCLLKSAANYVAERVTVKKNTESNWNAG